MATGCGFEFYALRSDYESCSMTNVTNPLSGNGLGAGQPVIVDNLFPVLVFFLVSCLCGSNRLRPIKKECAISGMIGEMWSFFGTITVGNLIDKGCF